MRDSERSESVSNGDYVPDKDSCIGNIYTLYAAT